MTTEEINYIREEANYSTNYGLIDVCDLCGHITPIFNHHDGTNYLTVTGKHIYCQKCMAEPSGRNEVS